jgi:hypothetical protein
MAPRTEAPPPCVVELAPHGYHYLEADLRKALFGSRVF